MAATGDVQVTARTYNLMMSDNMFFIIHNANFTFYFGD